MATPPVGTPPLTPHSRAALDPIRAVSAGWRAFLANPWVSLGVLVVLFAISLACGLVPIVNILASALVSPALYAGGAWFFLRGIRRENPSFETAFEGFRRWPTVTGALLLVGLVGLLLVMPLFVVAIGTVGMAGVMSSRFDEMPGLGHVLTGPIVLTGLIVYPLMLWWNARAGMVLFTVMEADRPSAIEAIQRSFALTRGSVWRILGLFLLFVPVLLLGLVALCVGILPAALVTYYAYAHAYEQLRARAA